MTKLNQLADLLETQVPEGGFYMGTFCGTACCVGGWAIAFFGDERDKKFMDLFLKEGLWNDEERSFVADYNRSHTIEYRAAELLEADHSRMFQLFYGMEPGLEITETDPKVAAEVLRHVAKELDNA